MFEYHKNEKLAEWKKFRDHLETSETPMEDLAEFWSRAPFVGHYLDPNNPSAWPDPWALILDGKFDDLAISLGMLYTIKLTQRFKDADCKIFMTAGSNNKTFLLVDNSSILNWEYRSVCRQKDLIDVSFKLIWSKTDSV